MSKPMSEQEIRLEVIKALIMSGATNMLRGNYQDQVALKADPLVAYIAGTVKKPEPEVVVSTEKKPEAEKAKDSDKKEPEQKAANASEDAPAKQTA